MKKILVILIVSVFCFGCNSNNNYTSETNQSEKGFNYGKKNNYSNSKENKQKENNHHEGCTAPCCTEE